MNQPIIVACGHCHRKNRLDLSRLDADPRCGVCKQALFTGQPVSLNAAQFRTHASADLPLIVDFWAPWCGPCLQFAPVFEQAAASIEPRARLVKINTEDEQALAGQYGIRSIPTLMLIRGGKEVTRMAGALPAAQFRQWVSQQLG